MGPCDCQRQMMKNFRYKTFGFREESFSFFGIFYYSFSVSIASLSGGQNTHILCLRSGFYRHALESLMVINRRSIEMMCLF